MATLGVVKSCSTDDDDGRVVTYGNAAQVMFDSLNVDEKNDPNDVASRIFEIMSCENIYMLDITAEPPDARDDNGPMHPSLSRRRWHPHPHRGTNPRSWHSLRRKSLGGALYRDHDSAPTRKTHQGSQRVVIKDRKRVTRTRERRSTSGRTNYPHTSRGDQ